MNEIRDERLRTDALSLRESASARESAGARNRAGVTAVLDWQCAVWCMALQTQAETLRQWTTLQKAIFDVQADAWDRLTCRFGGGIPLDG